MLSYISGHRRYVLIKSCSFSFFSFKWRSSPLLLFLTCSHLMFQLIFINTPTTRMPKMIKQNAAFPIYKRLPVYRFYGPVNFKWAFHSTLLKPKWSCKARMHRHSLNIAASSFHVKPPAGPLLHVCSGAFLGPFLFFCVSAAACMFVCSPSYRRSRGMRTDKSRKQSILFMPGHAFLSAAAISAVPLSPSVFWRL